MILSARLLRSKEILRILFDKRLFFLLNLIHFSDYFFVIYVYSSISY